MQIIPVSAAIITSAEKRGSVLVGRRRQGLNDSGKWEFPGGKILPGEDPGETVRREIEEEFGIQLLMVRLYDMVNYIYSEKNVLILFYLAEIYSSNVLAKDHDEILWAGPEELLKLDFLDADRVVVKRLSEDMKMGRVP
jgi:8-oxo-dGTP diphosphatase